MYHYIFVHYCSLHTLNCIIIHISIYLFICTILEKIHKADEQTGDNLVVSFFSNELTLPKRLGLPVFVEGVSTKKRTRQPHFQIWKRLQHAGSRAPACMPANSMSQFFLQLNFFTILQFVHN
jgi:hypothetical protein